MSAVTAIADAVKAAVIAAPPGTFATSFTATRVYLPLMELAATSTARVLVVPKARELSKSARGRALSADVQIDVAVVKKVTADPATEAANAEIDPLLALTDALVAFFEPGAAYASGQLFAVESPLIYDTERLQSTGKVFVSLITLTFKIL